MIGQIYISNSISDISQGIANNYTIIALVDNGDEYRYISCVVMGNLLPPYESLSAEIDGDMQAAAQIYYQYLIGKIPVISNIIAAMYKGKNILLFVPPDESMNFNFVNVFMMFFAEVFGIGIGTGQSQCTISDTPQYEAMRADTLFINSHIDFETYCSLMPSGSMPSEYACNKIMQMSNYRFTTIQECATYCFQYINSMKRQQQTGMQSVVFRVNKP